MYSDLKQKETLQASFSIQNLESPIFITDLEKEEYVDIFPETSLNNIIIWISKIIFPWE